MIKPLLAALAIASYSLLIIHLIDMNGQSNGASTVMQQAMDRGYAIHCPEDGVLRWKEECGK